MKNKLLVIISKSSRDCILKSAICKNLMQIVLWICLLLCSSGQCNLTYNMVHLTYLILLQQFIITTRLQFVKFCYHFFLLKIFSFLRWYCFPHFTSYRYIRFFPRKVEIIKKKPFICNALCFSNWPLLEAKIISYDISVSVCLFVCLFVWVCVCVRM